MMFEMTDLQYQAVYNTLSFTLASMSATTMYLWFRAGAVADKYKSAVYISGLVTFIAAYHYIRIFNSWVDATATIIQKQLLKVLELRTRERTAVTIKRGGAKQEGTARAIPLKAAAAKGAGWFQVGRHGCGNQIVTIYEMFSCCGSRNDFLA